MQFGEEVRMARLFWGVLALLGAGSLLPASGPQLGTVGEAQINLPSGGRVLYSQLDNPSGWLIPDQDFGSSYGPAYDAEAADDFVVTSPDGWDLLTLNTPGALNADAPLPLWVSVLFYKPAGFGVPEPGAPLFDCQFPANTTFASDHGDLSIEVDCTLPPGAYWFSQQVRVDYLPSFQQHFWGSRDSTSNLPAVWRNPSNGFGTGCDEWDTVSNCLPDRGEDMLFELRGQEHDPDAVPAIGPLGILLSTLALAAAATYLTARRPS